MISKRFSTSIMDRQTDLRWNAPEVWHQSLVAHLSKIYSFQILVKSHFCCSQKQLHLFIRNVLLDRYGNSDLTISKLQRVLSWADALGTSPYETTPAFSASRWKREALLDVSSSAVWEKNCRRSQVESALLVEGFCSDLSTMFHNLCHDSPIQNPSWHRFTHYPSPFSGWYIFNKTRISPSRAEILCFGANGMVVINPLSVRGQLCPCCALWFEERSYNEVAHLEPWVIPHTVILGGLKPPIRWLPFPCVVFRPWLFIPNFTRMPQSDSSNQQVWRT